MADQEYQTFQAYSSAEEAQPLLDELAARGIAAKTVVDKGQLAFDVSFANNKFVTSFLVKLLPADFELARQLQDELNQAALREVSPDHYLFGFSDDELLDLLAKPDEWSSLDVALAGQLLRQRGYEVTPAALAQLRQHRVAELARPEPSHPFWVVLGYAFALLGGLFGVLIGYHLHFYRKPLPDGSRVHAFGPRDRANGLVILIIGLLVLVTILAMQAVRLVNEQSAPLF